MSAEIRIVKASHYVMVSYIPVWSKDELVRRFEEESEEKYNDFVECLVFSSSSGVIMTGCYSNGAESDKVAIFYTTIYVAENFWMEKLLENLGKPNDLFPEYSYSHGLGHRARYSR